MNKEIKDNQSDHERYLWFAITESRKEDVEKNGQTHEKERVIAVPSEEVKSKQGEKASPESRSPVRTNPRPVEELEREVSNTSQNQSFRDFQRRETRDPLKANLIRQDEPKAQEVQTSPKQLNLRLATPPCQNLMVSKLYLLVTGSRTVFSIEPNISLHISNADEFSFSYDQKYFKGNV